MKINKEDLKTLWYEDEKGNDLGYKGFDFGEPKNALYQVSQFPNQLTTTYLKRIKQEDVDKCKHPRKYIKSTYGWIDGIVGRECSLCHGIQTKKKGLFHRWGKKWNGDSSREVFSCRMGWSEDLVLAMAKSGDYTLGESIIIAATSCERCMNVLRNKYGLDGYEEYSEEWHKAGTSCKFCEESEGK